MEYNIGASKNSSPEKCVEEATAKFKNPKLILFFSTVPDFEKYTELMHKKFPNSICMGSTSIAMFSNSGADKEGLKAIGFESGIKCSAGVLEDIDKYPIKYVDRVKKAVDEVGTSKNTICLTFSTALLCAEESVLATLNSVCLEKGIQVFGGSAGDVGTAVGTYVSLNGKIRDRSSVFAIIHNEGGKIKIVRENIYKPVTGNVLTATKADAHSRTVYEYNNQPAMKVFAKELGVSEAQAEKQFDNNPLGRIVGEELYITANCNKAGNSGVTYHARVYNNSRIMVLGPRDYKKTVEKTMEKIKKEIPHPSFSLMCHCLARTILFDNEGYLQEYSRKMGDVLGNYIGFSGYGEQSGEQHFNQTMTVAIFE